MQRALATVAAVLVLWFGSSSLGWSSERLAAASFVDVHRQAVALGQRYGSENVLLVFDIDNTLLAMSQDLGSDQWFDWQDELLDHRPPSNDRVANDLPGLLAAQSVIFTLGKMRPTHASQPRLVQDLQQRGFPTLVLTSRGPNVRDATAREIARNGYDFSKHTLDLDAPPAGAWYPYAPGDVAAAGMTADEARSFGLRALRLCSFADGILMTAGQHKGSMLLMMLARTRRRYAAVIFVDDRQRHTEGVFQALQPRGYDVVVMRYGREDDEVKAFENSDKQHVIEQWRDLIEALEATFGSLPPGVESIPVDHKPVPAAASNDLPAATLTGFANRVGAPGEEVPTR